MLYLFAQDATPPDTMIDVLMWPVMLTLAAWLVFYFGWWIENRFTKAPWKWLALLPIGYALYTGGALALRYQDPFYQSMLVAGGQKKMMAAHYGAFLIPLLGLVGIILFHFFNHKLNLPGEDD